MTAVVPLLDVDSLEELQPPCEGRTPDGSVCGKPAVWIVRFKPSCTHILPLYLACEPCVAKVRNWYDELECLVCDSPVVFLSLEPLR